MTPKDHIHTFSEPRVASTKLWLSNRPWTVIEP
jgi:hypothetical protein